MDPLNPLIEKARVAVRLDRYKMAATFATQALALDPHSDDAKLQLARALYYADRDEEARLIFLQLIASQPNDPRAYGFLGNIEFFKPRRVRSLALALDSYQQALTRDVQDPFWSYRVIRCLRQMKRFDDAEEVLSQALGTSPLSVSLHREGVRIAMATQRRFMAARHLRRLLALAPDHAKTHDQ
ncbi:MAG: tetratricopeptide repeat protein, partial [Planctomycetota bacterium]